MATRKKKVTIIHNSSCSKSREGMCVLKDLEEKVDLHVVEYLKDPLSVEEITALLRKLRIPAEDLVRKKEPLFKEKFATKKYSEEQWIRILHKNPVLIERPIIIKGDRAIIGRPTESIKEFLGE
jgi:arsenate reductase